MDGSGSDGSKSLISDDDDDDDDDDGCVCVSSSRWN